MKNRIQKKLDLSRLKSDVHTGALGQQRLKKMRQETEFLIDSADFLDNIRQESWKKGLTDLSLKELKKLQNSIIEEKLRRKEGKSTLKLEKIKSKKPDLFKIDDLSVIEEPSCPNIDFLISPQKQEKKLDKVFFILIYALAEIFEKEKSLRKTVLILKTTPLAFSTENKNHQKALEIIAEGLKQKGEWQDYLSASWSTFVGSIKEYYLLIENAK